MSSGESSRQSLWPQRACILPGGNTIQRYISDTARVREMDGLSIYVIREISESTYEEVKFDQWTDKRKEGVIWKSGERENSKCKWPELRACQVYSRNGKKRGCVDRVLLQLDLLFLLSHFLGSNKIVNSKGKYNCILFLVLLNNAPVQYRKGLMFKFWILLINNYIAHVAIHKTWCMFFEIP